MSEQNESRLHRAVEKAQAVRWEGAEDGFQGECCWCQCYFERGTGAKCVNGEEACSTSCMNGYNDNDLFPPTDEEE